MRGIAYRWNEPPARPGPVEPLNAGLEPLTERVLRSRGFSDASEARAFLSPSLAAMHDPALLPGIDRASERLLDALRAGEPIAIYGDYDVDGITASAILWHTFRAIAPDADVRTHIPHRLDDGYGLHAESIERLADEGARVIVSVDCGITAIEPARVARARGIDLIVTDHHNPPSAGDELPEAFEIVHPRLPGSRYPWGELCGAGVALKLAWKLACAHEGRERVSDDMREVLIDCIALAALGTVADVVPLLDENRAIVAGGLKRMLGTNIEGLRVLVELCAGQRNGLDAESIGFGIAPRINASGRLGHAEEALELLTTAHGARAHEIASMLDEQNEQRRRVERKIFDDACEMAAGAGMLDDHSRAIVLAHREWHPGVVGIVCSRLVGKFGRPAILLCDRGEGVLSGSGRSIDGFNLHAGLGACAHHLTSFGGHDMAAGLALEAGNVAAFAESFALVASEHIDEQMMLPSLRVDCEAELHELTPLAIRQLESLGPFGRSNAKPSIMLRGLSLTQDAEVFGGRGAHLKLTVRSGSDSLRFIGWRWSEQRERLRAGETIDAIVEPKLNHWNGRSLVEPVLRDAAVRTPV
ncbi:MAG: single-stranded-DNA-specific exonuclease RecJ [Planctomycetota bacterium]